MPTSAILQPPKKKLKRKVKVLKKRQKTIPVLLLLPLPLLLSPATPLEPISADKVNKGEDKNVNKPIEVEDKNIGLLSPLPPVSFISVQKVVIGSRKESLPSIRLDVLNTKSIYYSKLDKWQIRLYYIYYHGSLRLPSSKLLPPIRKRGKLITTLKIFGCLQIQIKLLL